MATPQLLDSGFHLGQMTPDAMKIAFHPASDLSKADTQSLGAVLRINAALQTTLDIYGLITLFAGELGRLVPIDSIRYRHDRHELDIGTGKGGRHSSSYRLIVGEELLGDLRVSRRRKFTA